MAESVQDGGTVSFGFGQNSAVSGGYSGEGGRRGGRRRWCKLVDEVIEEGSIFVAGSEMMMRTKTTTKHRQRNGYIISPTPQFILLKAKCV